MSDGIPFFFTAAQKAALSALGYTAAQIAEMAPAQAHEILKVNGQPVASAQPGVEINPPGRNRLSAVDAARIDSWMLELAQAARGGMREELMRLAVRGEQALIVHSNGQFFDFSAGRGGRGALDLLSLLRGSDEAAQSAARAWLAGHAGDGRLGRSQGDDESEDPSADDAGRAAYVKGLLDYAQPPSQEMIQYLGGRNLDPVARRECNCAGCLAGEARRARCSPPLPTTRANWSHCRSPA